MNFWFVCIYILNFKILFLNILNLNLKTEKIEKIEKKKLMLKAQVINAKESKGHHFYDDFPFILRIEYECDQMLYVQLPLWNFDPCWTSLMHSTQAFIDLFSGVLPKLSLCIFLCTCISFAYLKTKHFFVQNTIVSKKEKIKANFIIYSYYLPFLVLCIIFNHRSITFQVTIIWSGWA